MIHSRDKSFHSNLYIGCRAVLYSLPKMYRAGRHRTLSGSRQHMLVHCVGDEPGRNLRSTFWHCYKSVISALCIELE